MTFSSCPVILAFRTNHAAFRKLVWGYAHDDLYVSIDDMMVDVYLDIFSDLRQGSNYANPAQLLDPPLKIARFPALEHRFQRGNHCSK
jgi:hypothetical protein